MCRQACMPIEEEEEEERKGERENQGLTPVFACCLSTFVADCLVYTR